MAVSHEETRPMRSGEELDVARLQAYLLDHVPDARAGLVVTQFPSGHSNLTYLLKMGDTEMVLRRPPFGDRIKSAHDMGREYRVLSRLYRAYAPAPRAYVYCDDEAVMGAPFYVMERRRGLVLRNPLPADLPLDPPTVRRLSEAFIDNLADLHSIDYAAVGLGDLGRPEGYVQRQIEGWAKRYANVQTEDVPTIDTVMRWLAARIPRESGAALIHNDYKYDNLILDPTDLTRVVAVLDWEMCTIGDPLLDLGTTLAYWWQADDRERSVLTGAAGPGPTMLPGSLMRRELVERYSARTGREVSDPLFLYGYGLFKLAVILQQLYYRYVRGFTQDARFASLNQSVAWLGDITVRAIETGRL